MDFILLGVITFYFIKGYFKGFLQILFSVLSTIVVVLISYKLSGYLAEYLNIIFNFEKPIKNLIDQNIVGNFSSVDQLLSIFGEKSLFKYFFIPIISNITFEGDLSAGEILAPSLNSIILKIIAFLLIFFALSMFFLLFKSVLKKLLKILNLKQANRLMGGIVGIFKGLIIFLIFYVVLFYVSNITLNASMIEFCRSGEVSNFIYNSIVLKLESIIKTVL